MALTISNLSHESEGSQKKALCLVTFDSSYPTGGETLTAATIGMAQMESIKFEDSEGYAFDADIAGGGASALLKAYRSGAGTITAANESAHTHAVALDGGASGAEAAHTHAVALDGGTSDAGSSHNHAFTGTAMGAATANVMDDDSAASNGTALYVCNDLGKIEESILASESANGATAALETDEGLTSFVVYKPIAPHNVLITDADGAAGTGVAIYARPLGDGRKAKLVFVSPSNADGTLTLNNGGDTLVIYDDDAAADNGSVQVYCDEDATDGDRLQVTTADALDLYVEAVGGRWIKLDRVANAGASGVAIYFDEDAGNSYERLLFVSPTDTDCTNANDSVTAWGVIKEEICIPVYFDEDGTAEQRFMQTNASTVDMAIPFIDLTDPTASPRLLNIIYHATASATGVQVYFDDDGGTADERLLFVSPTDTNGTDGLNSSVRYYGTVAAGANAAEAAHTHGPGTLADAASGAGSAHSHGPGTLADAASAGGSAHTHVITGTAAALAEVTNGTNLSAVAINIEVSGH